MTGVCEAANGDRFAYSRLTDTWYRVTEYEDHGDGKLTAKSKTIIDRSEVPDECLAATAEQTEADTA
jgi:hypothetical protein